jgi:hypothetical protein
MDAHSPVIKQDLAAGSPWREPINPFPGFAGARSRPMLHAK